MESFIIEGGQSLKGSIKPQGAKNEALQILCATLLTPEPIIVNNIPNILDVNKLIKILANLVVNNSSQKIKSNTDITRKLNSNNTGTYVSMRSFLSSRRK